MQRRYRYWTEQEISELKRMADAHMRVTAIARRLDRTVGSIRTRASQEGISLTEMSGLISDLLPAKARIGHDNMSAPESHA